MSTPDINKILRADGRSCKYGAPLGDSNFNESYEPVYLQRVRFIDGDYGPDGTYWGYTQGEHLYCAFNRETPDHAAGHGTRIYVRAESRQEAKAEVLERYPSTKFIK